MTRFHKNSTASCSSESSNTRVDPPVATPTDTSANEQVNSQVDKPVDAHGDPKENKPADSKKTEGKLGSVLYFFFLPLSLLFMETVARISTIGLEFSINLLYIFLMSTGVGALLSAFCSLFTGKGRKAATIVVLTLFTVFMCVHVGYYRNFKEFFCFDQAGVAGNAITDFSSLIVTAAENIWYVIILMFIPLILFCIFNKKLVHKEKFDFMPAAICFVSAMILYFSAISAIYINGQAYGSAGYIYTYAKKEISMSYSTFGFINTTRLDIKQSMFGVPEEPLYIGNTSNVDYTVSSTDKEYGYNVLDIDFNELSENCNSSDIAEMHKYVSAQIATLKNEYTGYFEGKNLIMLSLESFSEQVIDPEFTPMLYKMATQGFVFNNYYHALWGGSTATGEYTNLTGNIYTNAACLLTSSKTYQPITMANKLKELGYSTHAYHNHRYTYYWRNLAYPNFGYDSYKGKDHGLKIDDCWPESDLSMAEQSVDDYINEEKFHVYYMTVSGHFTYSFEKNAMAALHEADLPEKYDSYPPGLRAYLAGQYEVELMLQYLVGRLADAGVLDDTVFVMAPDHYPYVLGDSSISKLYNLPRENILNNVELYKNSLIIWNSAMEQPVTVNKYCSAIDILPTLLNLWGIDYDSRLFIGSDILSTSEGIAIIHVNDGLSWKTDQGIYDCSTKIFTPSATCKMTDNEINEYVQKTNQKVIAKDSFSQKILKKNYYKYVFK